MIPVRELYGNRFLFSSSLQELFSPALLRVTHVILTCVLAIIKGLVFNTSLELTYETGATFLETLKSKIDQVISSILVHLER